MEFRFDANQGFQVKAIEAVADLFDGQAPVSAQVQFKEGTISLAAIDNRLDLDEARVLANLQAVQRGNGIQPDAKLECIEGMINTNGGKRQVRFPNFSVEMETGTGWSRRSRWIPSSRRTRKTGLTSASRPLRAARTRLRPGWPSTS
jgi:type III restriction enzyme